MIQSLTQKSFEDAKKLHLLIINGFVFDDDLYLKSLTIPLVERVEYFSHISNLLLNTMLNGNDEEKYHIAHEFRNIIKDIINEILDPNYLMIIRDRQLKILENF